MSHDFEFGFALGGIECTLFEDFQYNLQPDVAEFQDGFMSASNTSGQGNRRFNGECPDKKRPNQEELQGSVPKKDKSVCWTCIYKEIKRNGDKEPDLKKQYLDGTLKEEFYHGNKACRPNGDDVGSKIKLKNRWNKAVQRNKTTLVPVCYHFKLCYTVYMLFVFACSQFDLMLIYTDSY
eukprot:m.241317 g.241317  ORF g.241317 m.241317 type:complete len:179 (+) comp16087_c0_seq3:131-667(+)